MQLDKIEDSVKFINSRPKPLTIYAFTNNEKLKKMLIAGTSSGGITFNDTLVQVSSSNNISIMQPSISLF